VFVAVYVGRVDAEKGVEVLLDASMMLGMSEGERCLRVVGVPVINPSRTDTCPS
jgi:hypothetical protein